MYYRCTVFVDIHNLSDQFSKYQFFRFFFLIIMWNERSHFLSNCNILPFPNFNAMRWILIFSFFFSSSSWRVGGLGKFSLGESLTGLHLQWIVWILPRPLRCPPSLDCIFPCFGEFNSFCYCKVLFLGLFKWRDFFFFFQIILYNFLLGP